jgi:hypothetical protein
MGGVLANACAALGSCSALLGGGLIRPYDARSNETLEKVLGCRHER